MEIEIFVQMIKYVLSLTHSISLMKFVLEDFFVFRLKSVAIEFVVCFVRQEMFISCSAFRTSIQIIIKTFTIEDEIITITIDDAHLCVVAFDMECADKILVNDRFLH